MQTDNSKRSRGEHYPMQNVTPLHSAVHRDNLPLAKLLVENGANILSAMDNGDTALSIATRDGHTEIKEYLQSL